MVAAVKHGCSLQKPALNNYDPSISPPMTHPFVSQTSVRIPTTTIDYIVGKQVKPLIIKAAPYIPPKAHKLVVKTPHCGYQSGRLFQIIRRKLAAQLD